MTACPTCGTRGVCPRCRERREQGGHATAAPPAVFTPEPSPEAPKAAPTIAPKPRKRGAEGADTGPLRVLGYVRVSTDDQAENGHSLERQREAIERECSHRGWQLLEVIDDAGWSGKSLDRPGLRRALAMLDSDDADVIVAATLSRLSRSVADFASLLDRSARYGWRVVVLDVGVDTTTAMGEFMVSVLSAFAQYERRIISERTKAALRRKREAGVRLGRPRLVSPEVVAKIHALRAEGMGAERIAQRLNAEGIPTAGGGAQWHRSTVARIFAQKGSSSSSGSTGGGDQLAGTE